RTARCARDALRDRRIVGRYNVRAARSNDAGCKKRLNKVRQPVGINSRVCVGIGDDFTRRLRETYVARRAQSSVRYLDEPYTRMIASDLAGAIARTVVDDDDFVLGISEPLERPQVVFERVRSVVRTHDDGDAR